MLPSITILQDSSVQPKSQSTKRMNQFRPDTLNPLATAANSENMIKNWTEIKYNHIIPSCRTQAQAVTIDSNVYIYGGNDGKGNQIDSKLLWEVDPFSDTPRWRPIYINDPALIVPMIGGERSFTQNQKQHTINQLKGQTSSYAYERNAIQPYSTPSFIMELDMRNINNVVAKQVDLVSTNLIINKILLEITDIDAHTSVTHDDMVFIFGGYINQSELSNSMIKYTIPNRQLAVIESKGVSPCARAGHSATIDNQNQMYLFGGHTHSLEDKLNDMWIFNIKNCVWTEVQYSVAGSSKNLGSRQVPVARSGHSMVLDSINHKVIVFGGSSGEKSVYELNDMWQFNVYSNQWQMMHSSQQNEEKIQVNSPISALKLSKIVGSLNKELLESPLRKLSMKYGLSHNYVSNFNGPSTQDSLLKVKPMRIDDGNMSEDDSQQNNDMNTSSQFLRRFQGRLSVHDNIVKVIKVESKANHIRQGSLTISNKNRSYLQTQMPTTINGMYQSEFQVGQQTFEQLKMLPHLFKKRVIQSQNLVSRTHNGSTPNKTLNDQSRIDDNEQNLKSYRSNSLNKQVAVNRSMAVQAKLRSTFTESKQHRISAFGNGAELQLQYEQNNYKLNLSSESKSKTQKRHKLDSTSSFIRDSITNPNTEWGTRDSISFRGRSQMLQNKKQAEKKQFQMKFKQSKDKDQFMLGQDFSVFQNYQQAKSNPGVALKNNLQIQQYQQPPQQIQQVQQRPMSPITNSLINTFICQYRSNTNNKSPMKSKTNSPSRKSPTKTPGSLGFETKPKYKLRGNFPAQRDGASMIIVENQRSDQLKERVLFLFGGDRFQRAFNDSYIFPI